MDELTAYFTEWSKSERERQIPYINSYVWNLEKWYPWYYVQGGKDTDGKNRLLDSVGEGEGGVIWKNSIETNALGYVIDGQCDFAVWCRASKIGALW